VANQHAHASGHGDRKPLLRPPQPRNKRRQPSCRRPAIERSPTVSGQGKDPSKGGSASLSAATIARGLSPLYGGVTPLIGDTPSVAKVKRGLGRLNTPSSSPFANFLRGTAETTVTHGDITQKHPAPRFTFTTDHRGRWGPMMKERLRWLTLLSPAPVKFGFLGHATTRRVPWPMTSCRCHSANLIRWATAAGKT